MSRSVATIDNPEFINIVPYNPLISHCEIKVLYTGKNRNHTDISKDVAKQMANSLPCSPIVGYFKEDKQDFRDHGKEITVDADGVHFNCKTIPYGFVSPNAKVWFQKFEDTDDFGNTTIREYLMTEGLLWTGQFEEAKKVIQEGRPQSMELDEESLNGEWVEDINTHVDFFIVNDAIFSKLCILGTDIEPCFEGSSITASKIKTNFSYNEKEEDSAKKTLFKMMSELMDFTKHQQGGEKMEQNENGNMSKNLDNEVQNPVIENNNNTEGQNTESPLTEPVEGAGIDSGEGSVSSDTSTFAASKDDKKDKENESSNNSSSTEKNDNNKNDSDTDDEDKKDKTKKDKGDKNYSLLEERCKQLEEKFASLEKETNSLREFKLQADLKKKQDMIDSFYMLSDEDKSDVQKNIATYSIDDIEAKLSVICFRNKVSFNNANQTDTNHSNIGTYSLNIENGTGENVSPIVAALQKTHNKNN